MEMKTKTKLGSLIDILSITMAEIKETDNSIQWQKCVAALKLCFYCGV
jgi:hypothetical protein